MTYDTPVLHVDRLALHHGTGRGLVTALEDVSFCLARGERVVLLGPSGCGKTSLLNAIAGFLRPTRGAISVNGRDVTGPGPDRMVVFQEFDQLLPWKTVIENVAFPLRISRHIPAARARVEAAEFLWRVGLTDFAEAYPHTLSGGMKQRVAIARALTLTPELLLMDEPFAALDALTRRRMQEELVRLWQQHEFTLVFVTHAIDEAILIGDRILAFSARPGRIIGRFDVSGLGPEDRGSSEFAALERELQALLLPTEETVPVAMHA